jgi:hypothetical protein
VSTALWDTPSAASILASQLPSTRTIRAKAILHDAPELLAEIPRAHGYVTAPVISHSYIDASRNFDQSFDYFEERSVRPKVSVTSADVSDDATAFIRENSSARHPFFLFVHYFDTHSPVLEHPGYEMAPADGAPSPRRHKCPPAPSR